MADRAQRELARNLVGKEVRWNHQSGPEHPKYRVLSSSFDGLIKLEGWAGEFAPHLFVVVDGSQLSEEQKHAQE